jgi:hypothetical protein
MAVPSVMRAAVGARRATEPVAEAEGGGGEAAATVRASVVLDALAVALAQVVSVSDEAPVGAFGVEVALRVGAVGRLEATGSS